MIAIHPNAEAHAQDALLARRQACEHLGGGLTQIGLDRGIEWRDRVLVLDEIAQNCLLSFCQSRATRLCLVISNSTIFSRAVSLSSTVRHSRSGVDINHLTVKGP